jgi:hypothetical protein
LAERAYRFLVLLPPKAAPARLPHAATRVTADIDVQRRSLAADDALAAGAV